MSAALTHADLIRTRLLTAPAGDDLPTVADLTGLTVIVDRQKNIGSEISTTMAKGAGNLIVILWNGPDQVLDANAHRPRIAHNFRISVWSVPILKQNLPPADDIMDSIIARLWHWRPDSVHCFSEVTLKPGGMVPNTSYLIYDLDVQVPASL